MNRSDGVQVELELEVEPRAAFRTFTEEIDLWWGRGPRYRFVAPFAGTMQLEPGVGGRLMHVNDEVDGEPFVIGRVTHWEPPARLALSWRLPNFAPLQITRVEVRFAATPAGTRVVVTHSGWDGLPLEHPARHGLDSRGFILMMGHWWGELLDALRTCTETDEMESKAP